MVSLKIHSLVLRQTQESILNEEINETLSIHLVSIGTGTASVGETGASQLQSIYGPVVGRHTAHKRDVESEWFTTPDLSGLLIPNYLVQLDEAVWTMNPLRMSPHPETDRFLAQATEKMELDF